MKKAKIIIVGGGLAGLTAAIHLAINDFQIQLFEKDPFPRHKVCGEYLSKEVLPYLESLDIALSELDPVEITKLIYSTPAGKTIRANLPLGGIGLSRYALDNFLFEKAKNVGVTIIPETVNSVEFKKDRFNVVTAEENIFSADLVLGAYGKRSGLDKKLKRHFIGNKSNWLAVKSHYELENYPKNTVSLHNFKGGYCGLSKTETGAVNVCYLATYQSFKDHKTPETYKQEVLCKNPQLREFFENATPLFEKELTIAQVSFENKSLVEDHVLMMGDAAGLIHPLCGNGMAMAMHSAKLASDSICKFQHTNNFRENMEKDYRQKWNTHFRSRLKAGRVLQTVLLNPRYAELSQNIIKAFPGVLPKIITRTHGKPVL